MEASEGQQGPAAQPACEASNPKPAGAQSSGQGAEENQWTTAWWACHEDVPLSMVGLACPFCLYADNVTRLEGRYTAWCPPMSACFCLSLLLLCTLVGGESRRELRQTFHLPQSPANDYLVHCLLAPCALCQEAREIKSRSQLVAPPRAAARLVAAAAAREAPEVQFVTRDSAKPMRLAEWDWRARRQKGAAAASPAEPAELAARQ